MDGREAALRALGAYRRDGTWPGVALNSIAERTGLPERETALASQILHGVFQNMAYCDYIVSSYSSDDVKKLHPRVLDILRISIYQIIFLTRIPHRAAVFEGVRLARKYSNPRAAGFVNAILRIVASSTTHCRLPEVTADSEQRRLSVMYSHPEWLVGELCESLGVAETGELLAANNAPDTPITAQINPLLSDVDAVLSLLSRQGIDARVHDWLEDCVQLHNPGRIEHLEAFAKGFIYIQDAASKLAVIAADAHPGDFVIDGCAAPGGKSFAAAMIMGNSGRIAACDKAPEKLIRIEDGARRLGIGIIDAIEKDATIPCDDFLDKADIVLADVPCSGIGVIRKKPDIRYKAENEIAGLPEIQKRILLNLSLYVKPGGVLLYSTCSLLKRENEGVVEAFLNDRPEFSAQGFSLPHVGDVPDGMITLTPHIHGTDGFFIARLHRSLA